MEYNKALELLNNIIARIESPPSPLSDEMDKKDPVIYLCGKSATGKTTFLNALLNMKRDELFTSSDISTRAQFKFIYGVEQSYQTDSEVKHPLPITYAERKELFQKLNKDGNRCKIELPEGALKGRTIVDIPGILDYSHKKGYFEKMLNEADVVCFFTPSLGKVNAQEYEALKEISDANIPLVILFTMSDMTDPDEGITRKTLPDYVQKRLDSNLAEIKKVSHFLVSAEDFYKQKETHGIDAFLAYIQSNDLRLFEMAKTSRLKRLYQFHLEFLRGEIAVLENDAGQVKDLLKRENELWYVNEKTELQNSFDGKNRLLSRELERLKKLCKDKLFGCFIKSSTYKKEGLGRDEKIAEFTSMWDDFWSTFQTEYKQTIKIPKVPAPVPSTLFNDVEVDTGLIDEIKDMMFNLDEKDESESFLKDFKIGDLEKIGINLNNASVIYGHYTYFNTVTEEIDCVKETCLKSSTESLKQKLIELSSNLEKKDRESVENDTTIKKLGVYTAALDELMGAEGFAK